MYVVNRRTVVDQTTTEVEKLRENQPMHSTSPHSFPRRTLHPLHQHALFPARLVLYAYWVRPLIFVEAASMLSIQSSGAQLCDGIRRREFLRIGGLGMCGLGLSQLLGTSAAASDSLSLGRAKSSIVLFLMGGAPQHSTWDPKPLAPDNVRGDIAPISTNVPGVQFGELMPRLAQRADKLAVLRAVFRSLSIEEMAPSSGALREGVLPVFVLIAHVCVTISG